LAPVIPDESLRHMYAGGKPNKRARLLNRIGAAIFAIGLSPHWAVALEIVGRKSGKPKTLPVAIARYQHREYLVSMLGQRSQWVLNVRAAGGHAVLHSGRRRQVLLEEVAAENRAPILKAYLARAPGARPHIPVDKRAPISEFETISADFPVFEIHYNSAFGGEVNSMPEKESNQEPSALRDLARYAVVVIVLSVVFYSVGPIIGSLASITRSNVPAAALMFVCPTIAAVIVAHRTGRLRELMSWLRMPQIPWLVWVGAIAIMPVVIVLASVSTGKTDFHSVGLFSGFLLGVVYLASALGEEIGWTAFALPRLLSVRGEIVGAVVLGAFWASWHVIPWAQAGNSLSWIIGQYLFSIVFRMMLVRLTVASGHTLWPAVIAHASYNIAWSLSPNSGAGYNPWVVAGFETAVVVAMYLGLLISKRTPHVGHSAPGNPPTESPTQNRKPAYAIRKLSSRKTRASSTSRGSRG
jgi:deazaflavin-dependent oxidoreductase (nitroreductase family)